MQGKTCRKSATLVGTLLLCGCGSFSSCGFLFCLDRFVRVGLLVCLFPATTDIVGVNKGTIF